MARPRVATSSAPLASGRGLALVAIVLVALNLRTAVSSLSPIIVDVQGDIDLDGIAIGSLGTLAPVGFAVAGLFSPWIARRIGLELSLFLACLLMVLAHAARIGANDFVVLFTTSAAALIAAGVGNVLLPPVIKRYFPRQIGPITAVYVGMLAISAAIPAATAAPIANAAGWRVSLAVWVVFAASAAAPWFLLWRRTRAEAVADARRERQLPALTKPAVRTSGRLALSRVTWALTLGHGISSMNSYTVFAWLPALLIEIGGQTAVQAGGLLALYSLIGLPVAVVVPVIVARSRHPGLLFSVAAAAFAIGYTGMLLAPTTLPILWVVMIGIGPMLFAIVQVLLTLRTRDHMVTARVSGFVQGVGYIFGAVGPLTFGVLHELTGAWTAPLLFLLISSMAAVLAGHLLREPIMIDDELAAQALRTRGARKRSPGGA